MLLPLCIFVHSLSYLAHVCSNTLPKKVRNAEVAHYNFILVVGAKERDSGQVDVRYPHGDRHGQSSGADTFTGVLVIVDCII